MARRDEFDDEGFFDSLLNRKGNTELPPGLRRVFIGIGVLVLVGILIAVVFSSMPNKADPTDPGALPLIRADKSAFRVKPEDPGGMAVPNKDSTIFETLKGKSEDGRTENLLEDDVDMAAVRAREEVVAKVEKKTEPLVDVDLENEDASTEDVLAEMAKPKPKPVEKPVVKEEPKKPASIIDAIKEEAKAEPAKVVKKPEPVKPAPKPVAAGGSTYIQLASVKSEADATKQWAGLKAKNPELSALSLKVQKADLGDKGVFYRIQAGPLPADRATSVCASIKARGGSCLIAK